MTNDFEIEETFNTGISILFNEPEINIGDFGESLSLQFPDHDKIELCIANVEPGNTKLFAHHVWKASILLSRMILDLNDVKAQKVESEQGFFYGKRILEFGAGAGIPSILCSRLGAFVTASDYPDADLLKKLKLNLENNTNSNHRVIGHIWGHRNDELFQLNEKYDVILMADTLWMRDQHQNLLSDLKDLLKPEGIVLGVCGLHSGKPCIDSFFRDCLEHFKVDFKIPTLIPIGSGFGIDKEWIHVDESDVVDVIPDRNRFLYQFQLSFK